jgi:uncharacterized membrane protein YraQ (UPF0718 family)
MIHDATSNTALFLGTALSTCCHGILAISIQLYKKGASIPAIITLLMAAPWANFPMTILLVIFFKLEEQCLSIFFVLFFLFFLLLYWF